MAEATAVVARSGGEVARDASSFRRRATLLGACIAVCGVLTAFSHRMFTWSSPWEPYDFDINLVGARRLLEGRNLYDAPESRIEAVRHVSSVLSGAYRDTFTSFVGAPIVAALHAPFSTMAHSDAVNAFWFVNLVCMFAAIGFAVAALPRSSRIVGVLVGVGALGLSQPFVATWALGQFHGLVMLGFALGIWGVARNRPVIAGIGLGIAVVLKLSPILLVAYLCVRGWRRVVVPTIATGATLSLAALIVGTPTATFVWLRDVVPHLSGGTRYLRNQSIPAWLERLVTRSDDLTAQVPLGVTRFLGPLLAVAGCFLLWRMCRRHTQVAPVELGAVILVVLLAGPLSWDHYFVWAVIPIVGLCDLALWADLPSRLRCVALLLCGVALLTLSQPLAEVSRGEVAANWTLRVSGTPYATGGLLLFAVIVMVLGRFSPARREVDPALAAAYV